MGGRANSPDNLLAGEKIPPESSKIAFSHSLVSATRTRDFALSSAALDGRRLSKISIIERDVTFRRDKQFQLHDVRGGEGGRRSAQHTRTSR